MLPGKKYKPEDIFRIARRRIWLLLVPFAVVSAATAVIAHQLPVLYRSDSLILVVPQRVPESYVRSTVTTRIEDRLQAIQQQILSRTRLERVIQEFDLYAEARQTGIMEDIVERMKRDITVRIQRGDAFSVSYVGRDPRTVQKVTDRLAGLFIEESLRDRENLAEGTNQFLDGTLEDARRRLVEQEQKVEEYRRRYAGELPDQLGANMQALQNAQVQIQNLIESLNRDQDRRLELERQLNLLEAPPAANMPPVPVAAPQVDGDGIPTSAPAAQQLAAARAALTAAQTRWTEDHPEVRRISGIIRELERKVEAEALAVPVSQPARVSPEEALRRDRIQSSRAELDLLVRQMEHKQSEEQRLRGVAAEYQRRVEAAPTRDTEMVELTRDYNTLQNMYTSLLSKREDARISANLERRQIGEQFKLLDPARVPERPFSPNREQITAFGMLAGLGLGVALIGLLEYRDTSFKTDEEVSTLLELPVLATVPFMQSEREQRRARRRQAFMNISAGGAVTLCLVLLVYVFAR